MSERIFLSLEEAMELLPEGDQIHTFVSAAFGVIGANWDREDIIDLLKTGGPELSGIGATGMGHGIVAFREVNEDTKSKPIFIATKS